MPTVSVIIPTYNRAEMVSEAIQSVLRQTYTDYEIIVVDDGSTDNTHDVITRLSNKVTYVYQPNYGRSRARNHGISLARGKYIAFLDSDDLFLPDKLAKQLEAMEKRPDVLLSHTSYQRISAQGEYIEEIKSGTFSGNVYPDIIRKCTIATPTVMVRSEALSKDMQFNETLSVGEDVILWIQIASKSAILGIDEPLTQVRINASNAASDYQAQIIGVKNIIEYVVKQDLNLSPVVRRSLLANGHIVIGLRHLQRHEKLKFLGSLSIAVWNAPFSAIWGLVNLCYLEVIASYRRRHKRPIKKFKKSIHGQRRVI